MQQYCWSMVRIRMISKQCIHILSKDMMLLNQIDAMCVKCNDQVRSMACWGVLAVLYYCVLYWHATHRILYSWVLCDHVYCSAPATTHTAQLQQLTQIRTKQPLSQTQHKHSFSQAAQPWEHEINFEIADKLELFWDIWSSEHGQEGWVLAFITQSDNGRQWRSGEKCSHTSGWR